MDIYKNKVSELFGIDIRSLALFRIGLAFILLWDLIVRIQDVTAYYTDWGILPRDVLIEKIIDIWNISIHLVNGTWPFQFVLLIFAIICAIALLVGYQTRMATIISWILLISSQSRNPLILQGGDMVLRLLLFWSMFLPLGSYWSIDRWLNKSNTKPVQIVSMASASLLLQICFIYWFAALLKIDDSWRTDGTAVWYALSLEHFSTPLGIMLLQFPNLLKTFTFLTVYLEALGPFLAFSPIYTAPLRFATVIIFLAFHLLGLNLTMELGHFVYVCAVAWIVFIPGCFWDHFLNMQSDKVAFWKPSWLSNGLALFFIIYIFLWNVRSLGISVPILATQMQIIGPLFRVDQYWNMFSPYPIKEDGWFVVPGKLRDGTEVDLYTEGGAISWEKPQLVSATYKNYRWRSYMLNLVFADNNATLLSSFARYLCIQWNNSHPYDKQLMTFEIVFMKKINKIEEPTSNPVKVTLWKHYCFDSPDQIK